MHHDHVFVKTHRTLQYKEWILMYTDFKTSYLVGQGSQDGIQTVTKESNSAIYV